MKISSVKITSYGKFKEKVIDFKDGVNIIYGKNEAGKSTVMSFIKGMLYGFKGRGSALSNDRKKYLPWDTTPISGEIRLTTKDGRQIAISRTCGKTPAGDKSVVIDLQSGEKTEFSAETETGLSEEAFSKVLYVKQLACEMAGENDEITTKLINLSSGGDEETGYHTAAGLVEDAIRVYRHKRGDGGLINELKSKIMSLREEMENEKAFEADNFANAQRCRQIEGEIEKAEQSLKETDKKIDIIKKHLAFAKVKREQEQAEKLAQKIETVKKLLSDAEDKLSMHTAFKNEASNIIFEAARDTAELERQSKKNKNAQKTSKILAVCSLAAGVISLVAGFFLPWLFLIFAVFICTFIINLKRFNVAGRELLQLDEKIAEIKNKESAKSEELKKYGCSTLKEYTDKKAEYNVVLTRYEQLKQEKAQFEDEYKIASERLGAANGSFPEGFEQNKYSVQDLDDMQQTRESLFKAFLDLKSEFAGKNSKIMADRMGHRLPVEIEEEIFLCNEKLKESEENLNALNIVKDTLEEAYANISKTFAPQLNREASALISKITGGEHEGFLIDKQYNVVMEKGGFKEIEYFSSGTVDQVYLAVRLALSKMLTADNKSPMFFDDTFVQFDSDRTKNALKVIDEFSKDNQVFIFTCKDEFLNNTNYNIIKI